LSLRGGRSFLPDFVAAAHDPVPTREKGRRISSHGTIARPVGGLVQIPPPDRSRRAHGSGASIGSKGHPSHQEPETCWETRGRMAGEYGENESAIGAAEASCVITWASCGAAMPLAALFAFTAWPAVSRRPASPPVPSATSPPRPAGPSRRRAAP